MHCLRFKWMFLVCLTFCGSLVGEESVGKDLFAVEIALHENAVDGCADCGCSSIGTLASGASGQWWMIFGAVQPDESEGWARSGPEVHSVCGFGDDASIASSFQELNGAAYVATRIEIAVPQGAITPEGVSIRWTIDAFEGFGRTGKASYRRRELEHALGRDRGEESVVVLLEANQREREELGVVDLVVSIRLTPLNRHAVQYGQLEVVGDVPGAWILLDDAPIGRVSDAHPVAVNPVAQGPHRISVRDFSSRTASAQVEVLAGTVSRVELNLLPTSSDTQTGGLVHVGENPEGAEEFWRVQDGAFMVEIPSGAFLMGDERGSSEPDQRPAHSVFLDTYLIDKTEVTWRQFRKYSEATGAPLPPAPVWGRSDHFALSNTTWEEAQSYCAWVGGRLPTEAEWEKAARGNDERQYPWGQEWDPTRCNSISGGLHQPEPVGSFPLCSSAYGVMDMAGSHWQWVFDNYDSGYYERSPGVNPRGPDTGTQKVKRGGYWMNHPQQLTVMYRGHSSPTWRNSTHGFRCAVDVQGAVQ